MVESWGFPACGFDTTNARKSFPYSLNLTDLSSAVSSTAEYVVLTHGDVGSNPTRPTNKKRVNGLYVVAHLGRTPNAERTEAVAKPSPHHFCSFRIMEIAQDYES